MAKKNSSKTATEKAIQSSEPRVLTYKGWQGVNFVDAPLTWQPLETAPNKFRQTDLPDNYLMVQNNVVTTDTMSLETRLNSELVGVLNAKNSQGVALLKVHDYILDNGVWVRRSNVWVNQPNVKFTGVSGIYQHWIFHVVRWTSGNNWNETILYRSLLDPNKYEWNEIEPSIYGGSTNKVEICEIGFFENNLVATARDTVNNTGMLLLAKIDIQSTSIVKGIDWSTGADNMTDHICDTPKISPSTDRPGVKPVITATGMASGSSQPVRVEVKYCYTNRLGSTLTQTDANCATIYVELSPALWTTKKYVTITPAAGDTVNVTSVAGIDLYGRDTENLDWVFIGHVDVTPAQVTAGTWSYKWYGNMTDITQWLTAQLMVPTDNTTHGPDATHFDCHDSRMYYWGMPSKPYRLWIGGNPGSEFSIARGLGGAWVDIEPGSGYDIKGTAKWKTVSGANIVTILCGNRNTTKIKRFNLVETNLTLTNEVAYKSYMYEEVSNVVGCNSRWGFGVYTDGLYSLNRYGLMLTTMAMEYNSQMKNQSMSDVIAPIFTNVLGKYLSDGRMVCINDIIYIAFSDEGTGLDNVILCYDINLKAWYTWTHDETIVGDDMTDPDHVLHIFAIDSDEYQEGVGAVTENQVRLYPVTGGADVTVPPYVTLVETGELMPRQPAQAYWYIQQLEFRFDYFVGWPEETEGHPGPATVLIEGVDYYGRFFSIEKKLNKKSRSWQPINDNGVQAHHQIVGGESWDEPIEQRNYVEWVRIDKIVQSLRIRIKGHARFRLTHINAKTYQQSDTIGTSYGFDAQDTYYDYRHQDGHQIHHYIDDYNNLRRAVVS